jgi:AraC-like DNA-binding protein
LICAETRALLRDTRLPVERIAARCGYVELSGFYRAFRRAYGCAPGALRGRA